MGWVAVSRLFGRRRSLVVTLLPRRGNRGNQCRGKMLRVACKVTMTFTGSYKQYKRVVWEVYLFRALGEEGSPKILIGPWSCVLPLLV